MANKDIGLGVGDNDSECVMKPKVHWNGRIKTRFEFRPEVYDLLKELARVERRSMVEEVSLLIEERARSLNITR